VDRSVTDVKEAGKHNLTPVELICGGFPCQDVSGAGKGAGLAGSRSGLWFKFARIVGELRPKWVVVENVASGAKRWVDQVVAGLEQLDYEALPIPLSAEDVGAPHLRRRIFVIAYTECKRLREQSGRHGRQDREDSVEPRDACETGTIADTSVKRLQGLEHKSSQTQWQESACSAWSADTMPEPALCRVIDRSTAWLDRNKRLKALGNAVVPQCAEVIGYVIQEIESRRHSVG
jgi:DNA (cytosine-5)-methyltransferase 1